MPHVQAFLDPSIFPDGLIPDNFKANVNRAFQQAAASSLKCAQQNDMQPEWFMIVWHEFRSGDAFTRPMAFMMHVQHYPDRNIAEAVFQIRTIVYGCALANLRMLADTLDPSVADEQSKREHFLHQAEIFAVEVEISDGHNLEYSITPPSS